MKPQIKQTLRELDKTRDQYWNIAPEVGQFLNQLIKDRNFQTVLEIGTSNGYSGIWIAEALSHTKGTLYTIESHYKKRFHLATENFQKSSLTNHIKQILGHAPEVIPENPETFDLAFFDATKKEHIDFFNSLKSRIRKGGLIITDNILSHKEEFSEYIETVTSDKTFHTTNLDIGTGLLLSLKQV